MVGENLLIEIVLNGILRRIVIHRHFFQNYPPFTLDLPVRKRRMKGDVGDQLNRFFGVRFQHRSVKTNLFFGRICVEFTANVFQSVDDVMRLPPGGAFEGHVLPEMSQPLLMRLFVAAPDVEHKPYVSNLCMEHLLVGNTDAVGQGVQVIVFQKAITTKITQLCAVKLTPTMPGRFLIIQTAFIGDVILATALLEDLHRAMPEAQIDVLVRRGNESLFNDHPFVNQVLIWEKKKTKYRSLWQLLRQIRATPYQAVINLQRFGATGLLTAFSGAPMTVGFDKNPFARGFTHRVPHLIGQFRHEVERNNDLLRALNIPVSARPRPRLYPTPADYMTVSHWQDGPYICLAPTSVWFTKQFPAEGWVQVIQRLPPSWRVYLLGAPGDVPACERIRAAVGTERVVSLAGKLSLLQSAALMQVARMNYVNDSAPMHLCSAMNAPTTAVFCSTVPGFGFGPLADESRVVQVRDLLYCRPCNLHGRAACPLGYFGCAYGIRIDDVVGELN